ncbi:type IV secretory system conjugative DNA transfer family protein [Dongia sp.]|uniref:type IV secretory system conjugative DNA transfer family protein n=1 Tax=Dongia sp. TaxID=1977262 RepID=UPI0035AF9786
MAKSIFGDIIASLKSGWNFRFPWYSSASAVRRGFRNPFVTEAERERAETQALFDTTRREFAASPYAVEGAADDFIYAVVVEACERAAVTPSIVLGEALWICTRELLIAEGSIFGFADIDPHASLTLEEGHALRDYLNRKRRFLSDHVRLIEIWREKVIRIFEGILGYCPAVVLDGDEDEAPAPQSGFTASLIDLCETPPEVIERTLMTMFDDDVANARLFDPIREVLDRNALAASGIPPDRSHSSSKAIVLPTAQRKKSSAELTAAFLGKTPFGELFESRFPFDIPYPVRFEHTLVVGGTGHGKTQLLQLLIHHDLAKAREDGRSIVVLDSQGDLIRTIAHLAEFSPGVADSLSDKLLIIDPNDVEYPACLNMFDWNRERLGSFSPVDREKVLNGTIELYEYLFGALLGAELTQKQGVVFKYLARLMMEIPGATVHTLRQLMENGEPFRPYIAKLPGTARSFFETRFFDRSFNETKKQILTRLWGVLSNVTLERMFSYPKSRVDLFEATNSGKIILINTAKELLKQEGCAIFGRFFIALIAQATIQRAALPAHERRPTFVYIDEAQDYFDQNIEQLLNQARKYRVGMVLAHQNLDQLASGLRSSVMANTSIKFAGGVSAKDASTFASEMRSDAQFIQGFRKRRGKTEFACFVKNLTPQAIGVEIPLGRVESLSTVSDDDYTALITLNRARYCAPVAAIEALDRQSQQKTISPGASDRPSANHTKVPRSVDRGDERKIERTVSEMITPLGTVPFEEANAVRLTTIRPERSRAPVRAEPAPLGRGGKQHRYLQEIIKQAAEERNFRAIIEEPILDGAGKVDVSLTLGDHRIACEISVTTDYEHELGNIEKCLAAGFNEVVLLAPQERRLAALRKFALLQVPEPDHGRIRFLVPEDLIAHLDQLSAAALTTEGAVKGYRVRVTRKVMTEAETLMRRQAIAAVIARSLKKDRER